MRIEDVIASLGKKKRSTKCSEMIALLESLGFNVKAGKAVNHKVYVHQGLSNFYSSSFSCEHGSDKDLKLCYVLGVIKVLKQHTEDLDKYLKSVEQEGENND